MDGIVSSSPPQSPPPPPPPSTATTGSHAPSTRSGRDHRGTSSSLATSCTKECLSFAVSMQERLRYVKALLLGQAKKMRVRNDMETTEADLQTAKMQANAANDSEKRIHDKSA